MSKESRVIYIPGLRDQSVFNKKLVKLLPLFWLRQGFKTHVVFPHWEDNTGFSSKLRLITDEIDRLVNRDCTVFLVGQSAGGSAALNAFCQRREIVSGVVNATGRLRVGEDVRPTLDRAARNSVAFKESVLLFEQQNEPGLTDEDRRRIMTIRPMWDETVPSSTVAVRGAVNKVAPIVEHGIGGAFIVSFYSKVLLDFFKSIRTL